jgi:hypothetical protein
LQAVKDAVNCTENKDYYKLMIYGVQSCYVNHAIKNINDRNGGIGKRSEMSVFIFQWPYP